MKELFGIEKSTIEKGIEMRSYKNVMKKCNSMLSYGFSVPGPYHIASGAKCQDSNNIIRFGNDMVVAAVADGLGSEMYTHISSKIAANVSTKYCSNKIKRNDSKEIIIKIIEESFNRALRAIKYTSNKMGNDIDQYDTTLSLAVLIGDDLYYGHSGDSGIIALNLEGDYESVTEQQRDDEKRVFPLCFKDKWVFGKYEKKVGGMLLATDGMYESFFPVYIKNEKVSIYAALLDLFVNGFKQDAVVNGEATSAMQIKQFVENIDEKSVDDDKTIVVVITDNEHQKRQDESYYMEPDWESLKEAYQREWFKLAYPDLYNTQNNEKESIDDRKSINPKQSIYDKGFNNARWRKIQNYVIEQNRKIIREIED